MRKKYFITVGLLLSAAVGFAQKDTAFWNKEMIKIAEPTSTADHIQLKPEVSIKGNIFFSDLKSAFGLSANDEMKIYKTDTDDLGMTHYRYSQFYKGYKIIFAEFLVHEKNGRTISANGNLVKGLHKNPDTKLAKAAALQAAERFYPAQLYAWQLPQLEEERRKIFHNPSATYYPSGELVWISADNKGNGKNPENFILAYMFDIYTAWLDGRRIFIDANNGSVINTVPLVPDCTATSVTTNFNGLQSFSTKLIAGSSPVSYNLWNDCQTAFIHTYQWVNPISASTEYVSGANNNWSANASAASSHWAVGTAYSYYLSVFNRHSWDDNNGGVNVYQNALFCDTCTIPTSANSNNANFSGGTMRVGNAATSNTIDDYNAVDIIAHEYTHGVTEKTAQLVYSKESGALNESFSDILGVSCYAWFAGLTTNTWLIGYDRKNPANPSLSLYIRNMSNPNDKLQPDTYLSPPFWVSTTTPTDTLGDNWGVHTNSGVQNYMYYLLTMGGSGTNDNGDAFLVTSIGIEKARAIAYRALSFYLTANSQYIHARYAWVHAAADLYGDCSFEAIQTGKAWYAVGLDPQELSPVNICGTYGGAAATQETSSPYSIAHNCTAIITSTGNLVQFGGSKITINPGFTAQNGSRFRAFISDCRFAAY